MTTCLASSGVEAPHHAQAALAEGQWVSFCEHLQGKQLTHTLALLGFSEARLLGMSLELLPPS